jgi:hypothetical protein
MFLTASFVTGCQKEEVDVTDPERHVFNFLVTDNQRQYINTSRGEQYEITDPKPELNYKGVIYPVDRFEIRGDNTLNFARKGFSVNMDGKIPIYNPEEQIEIKYEEF